MSILIDKSTRLLVQGITGRDGLFHAKKMAEYGTNVVGGTSPGKGGTMIDDTFPVFNTIVWPGGGLSAKQKPIHLLFSYRHALLPMLLWRLPMPVSD